MGRARVVFNSNLGHYSLVAVYNETFREAESSRLQRSINELESRVPELSDALDAAAQERIDAADALETAIEAYLEAYRQWSQLPPQEREDPPDRSEVLEAETEAERALMRERSARMTLSQVLRDIESLYRSLDVLYASGSEREFTAWCADYTDDLEIGTEVAVLELTDEPGGISVIAPGGRAWSPEDGIEWPVAWMRPHQAYLNLALLPGVQRHRPMYREATLLSVEGTTCTIQLARQHSSQQGLDISPWLAIYSNVPIEYMGAESPSAFQELFLPGDRLAVEFDGGWSSPRVIGFATHPKPPWILVAEIIGVFHTESREDGDDPESIDTSGYRLIDMRAPWTGWVLYAEQTHYGDGSVSPQGELQGLQDSYESGYYYEGYWSLIVFREPEINLWDFSEKYRVGAQAWYSRITEQFRYT